MTDSAAKGFLRASAGRARPQESALARGLRRELRGEVLFDSFTRGRYSTDASIYQVEPVGVVVPRDEADVAAAIDLAREAGTAVLPRGAGTSQSGQTVNEALVVDCSHHLNGVIEVDPERRVATVEPGVVLDHLNRSLRPHGLWFPVDVSTSAQATLGGMAGNNSCGTRSLKYGNMVHNMRAVEALLADGTRHRFGPLQGDIPAHDADPRYRALVERLQALYGREADEIARRLPRVQRKVGGYNLECLASGDDGRGANLARLLVGSEGTLAFFQRLELDLAPLPGHRVLGICHFPTFRAAMEAAQPIVALAPAAVELVDASLIRLGYEIDIFRPVMERFVRGRPEALLLVEFAGDDPDRLREELERLDDLMADLGYAGGMVSATDAGDQAAVWGVRKAGLNIAMSMKGDAKPVSFVEDCAVPLGDLPDYTERLEEVFQRHGTTGTWYAHASEGCLHVRPILNLKQEEGARRMRAIAEEAFALVREYKGSHSGEHGDGIVRSEFNEAMFGSRLARAFGEVKRAFDPDALMNPGRIVDPPRMDDRSLMRFGPGYRPQPLETALDWSEHHSFAGAVEMCNNNGHCRKFDAAVMCPSYRATGEEKDLTRGRANSLRLALSGQLGAEALTSEAMYDTMALCVSCKGCKRECPTGVDMAKMKVEFLYHYHQRHGYGLRDRLIANLPRYAPWASRIGPVLNLRDRVPGLAGLSERLTGLSARRPLPQWHRRPFRRRGPLGEAVAGEAVLFADTFNRWQEPENLHAAVAVLNAAGYQLHLPEAADGGRPLCCGRTFLSVGDVPRARAEARRTLRALLPLVERGLPVVGLEPSCLLTLRDELRTLLPGEEAETVAGAAWLSGEFLASEHRAGRATLDLHPAAAQDIRVHGHCHQKAFDALTPTLETLAAIPGAEVEAITSTCCGMAGAFGYQREHYDDSMRIGELGLLPAVRAAPPSAWLVADGTSCRHQIRDATGREAFHSLRILRHQLRAAADGEGR